MNIHQSDAGGSLQTDSESKRRRVGLLWKWQPKTRPLPPRASLSAQSGGGVCEVTSSSRTVIGPLRPSVRFSRFSSQQRRRCAGKKFVKGSSVAEQLVTSVVPHFNWFSTRGRPSLPTSPPAPHHLFSVNELQLSYEENERHESP